MSNIDSMVNRRVEEWRSGGVEEWKNGGVEEWKSGTRIYRINRIRGTEPRFSGLEDLVYFHSSHKQKSTIPDYVMAGISYLDNPVILVLITKSFQINTKFFSIFYVLLLTFSV